jgi:hypothetical protein
LRIARRAPRAVWLFLTRPWLGIFYLVWAAWSYFGFESALLAVASLICWGSFKMMWQSRKDAAESRALSTEVTAQQEAIGQERARYMNRALEAEEDRDVAQQEYELRALMTELEDDQAAHASMKQAIDETHQHIAGQLDDMVTAAERRIAEARARAEEEAAGSAP